MQLIIMILIITLSFDIAILRPFHINMLKGISYSIVN